MMTEIEKGGVPNSEIEKYVMFLGLRKWDILGKRLVTEQIYVHAKVCIFFVGEGARACAYVCITADSDCG